MTDDLEKLINKALHQWKAREISLHFYGRKKGGVAWIARAFLDHIEVQARLVESGAEGSITLEKLTAMADRPVAQGQGKTAIEAITAITEQKWLNLQAHIGGHRSSS